MTGHPTIAVQIGFEDMASLVVDAHLFRKEFRLCDKISDYLSDIIAQTHQDAARFASFCSALINEVLELAFRLLEGAGQIGFTVTKSPETVRLKVAFPCAGDQQTAIRNQDISSRGRAKEAPIDDVFTLAHALDVDIQAKSEGDDRATLVVEFPLPGGAI
jgi:hypothetical protein